MPRQPAAAPQKLRGEACRLEVVRLHGLNWERDAIAEHLAVSERTVQRHLTGSGLPKTSKRKLSDTDAAELVARYAAGEGVAALGRAFDVSRGTVRMEVDRAGQPLHTSTQTKDIDTARVVELHNAGHDVGQIAAQLGIKPNTVHYHLFKVLGRHTGRPARRDSKRDRTVEMIKADPTLSDKQIADALGVRTATVSKHMWQARLMGLLPADFERGGG